jgi:hypothetical protein
VDFWAQHKDFVLRILAGFGVFLVAIIARSIVYGDDLENETSRNAKLAGEIARMKIGDRGKIRELEKTRDTLQRNGAELARQIGWPINEGNLELTLIRRILKTMREHRGDDDDTIAARAQDELNNIRVDLNGGFSQLRLAVRDDLVTEASELNVVLDRIGFENVIEMEPSELVKYLVQLELVSRIVRSAIDARIDGFEDINIETEDREEIPGANEEFLREYAVHLVFQGRQPAVGAVLDSLEESAPYPPWRELRLERVERPRDHIRATLSVLAIVVNTDVKFEAQKEKQ